MAVTSAPSQQHSDYVMGQHWPRMPRNLPDVCHLMTNCRTGLASSENAFVTAPRSMEALLPRTTGRLATSLSCDSSLAKYVSEVLRGLSDVEAPPLWPPAHNDDGLRSDHQPARAPSAVPGLSPQGKRSSEGCLADNCPPAARRKSSRTAEGPSFSVLDRCNFAQSAEQGREAAVAAAAAAVAAAASIQLALGSHGSPSRSSSVEEAVQGFSPKASPFNSIFAAATSERRPPMVLPDHQVDGKAAESSSCLEEGLDSSFVGGGLVIDGILRRVVCRESSGSAGMVENWDQARPRKRLQRLNSAPVRERGGQGMPHDAVNSVSKQLREGRARQQQEQQQHRQQEAAQKRAGQGMDAERPLSLACEQAKDPLPSAREDGRGAVLPMAAAAVPLTPPEKDQAGGVLPAGEPIKCKVAAMSCAGQKSGHKKANQDAYCFMRSACSRCLLFGVFDGHGPNGHDVAGYCKKRLPEELMKLPSLVPDPSSAFGTAFHAVNDCLLESDSSVSGTTAVMAQLHERRLTVAWVGDSRCVLASTVSDGMVRAQQLTHDHKPDCAEERGRIEENNGRVDRSKNLGGEEVGPFRVWLGIAPILGLAMSRSLGDTLAHSVGVISTPDIVTRDLVPEDRFMILATDGVWEWLTCDEAVEIVAGCSNLEVGCKKLVQAARQKWRAAGDGYIDDITAIVVEFAHQQ